MLAVEHGVHVHYNKSMTTTVDEADRLIAAAQAQGVKLVSSPGEMLRPRHRSRTNPSRGVGSPYLGGDRLGLWHLPRR